MFLTFSAPYIEYGFDRVPKTHVSFQLKAVVEILGISHLLSRAIETTLPGRER
ncbi:MAG: hypothetical protein MJA28_03850 [Gammaproteobacteria bacterium]|nr:hypothetical protein [Gammaproteobacteria bacterium]